MREHCIWKVEIMLRKKKKKTTVPTQNNNNNIESENQPQECRKSTFPINLQM